MRSVHAAFLVVSLLGGCSTGSDTPDATREHCDGCPPCGEPGSPCCHSIPVCNAGLECASGVCARGPHRCTVSGIADPALLTADFDAGSPDPCSDIPAELLSATTPGTFGPFSPGIGRIDCEGLTAGQATVMFQAHVRLLDPGRHRPDACWCGAMTSVGLDMVIEGIETIPVDVETDAGVPDPSCRMGPDFSFAREVTVGPDGLLSVRIDLRQCERGHPTNCLFVGGTALTIQPPG